MSPSGAQEQIHHLRLGKTRRQATWAVAVWYLEKVPDSLVWSKIPADVGSQTDSGKKVACWD